MSADLESRPMVSTRLLEGTLVTRAQFAEPVPDHLSQTKLFTNAQEHSAIKTKPQTVSFHGYHVGRLHQKSLRIINSSGDNVSLHIIPPTTQHFTIQYHKTTNHLVPGLGYNVTINFRPTEWKHYHDCIRIHCKDDNNLLIPINAYPVLNTSSFPRSISFRPTPVGHSSSHSLSLPNPIPVDFEYKLSIVRPHPSFTVSPMNGVVPGNGVLTVTVTFSPMEFSTAIMKLKLDVIQFGSQPLFCTFTGNATPGLALQHYKNDIDKRKTTVKAKQQKSTSRSSRPRLKTSSNTTKTRQALEMEYEGIRFPSTLDTPSAVAKVLSQKPGLLSATQLKTVSGAGTSTVSTSSYQLKEAVFLQQVKETDEEEKANRLRWMRHIGSNILTEEERESFLRSRNEAQKRYQAKYHLITTEDDKTRVVTELSFEKTIRQANQVPQATPTFDSLSNNDWLKRHRSLQLFSQAARRVVVQNRCLKRLELLQKLVFELKSGTPFNSVNDTESSLKLDGLSLNLSPPVFPQYVDQKKQQEALPSAPVATINTTISLNKPEIPLLALQVPIEYKTLGYTPLMIPQCIYYMPKETKRSLRTGAEKEYSLLTPLADIDLSYLWNSDYKEQEKKEELHEKMVPLTSHPSMFEPKHEDPFHIFNPCPEVIPLRQMLPNSEVTWEHHLLPLPTGSGAPHPQPKIDRYDGIPGVMKWKEFPSHFLVGMEGQKTLSSVWRPCLSDPFSTDLIPVISDPPQLEGPQSDDLFNDHSSESDEQQQQEQPLPVLTEEMIRAEFYIPDTSDVPLCTRRQHELDLLAEQKKSLDRVGMQHQQKYSHLLSLLK